jgi:hypothetical protein
MGHSLLAQGIVSRLRRSVPDLEVEAVDIERSDVYEKLLLIQPATLIVEVDALTSSPHCTIDGLLQRFPNLTVIEVALESPRLRLIQSGEIDSSGFEDLLQILARVDASPLGGSLGSIR